MRSIAALQDLVKPEILKFGKTKYGQKIYKKVNIKLKMMTSVEALQNLEKPCQIDIENGNPTAKKTFL